MEKSKRRKNSASQTGRRSRDGGVRPFSHLLNTALRLLQTRPRSTQEIQARLRRFSTDENLTTQVIEKLTSAKLLDDSKFTEWLIASRSRTRPRGRRLLEHELKSKGIDQETINHSLTGMAGESDLARAALKKKLVLWKHLTFRDFRIKAGRFLASRGFSWSAIETVLKTAYNEDHVS